MEKIGILSRVVRPHIVVGGLLGYLLGALLALNRGAVFNPLHFALGYAVVLAGDLSTHFSNDYNDVKIDRDSPSKTFGRSNALVEHPAARPAALGAAVFFSAAALTAAAYMVVTYVSPPTLLWIGPNGEERRSQRITGAVDAEQFLQIWTTTQERG